MIRERKIRECTVCHNKQRTPIKRERFICISCRKQRSRCLSLIKGTENFPGTILSVDVEVLIGLQEEDLPIKTLSNRIKLPGSSTYRSVSRLLQWGFIEKRDMLLCITDKGKRPFLKLKGWDLKRWFCRNKIYDGKVLRFHALQGKFNVVTPIQNYHQYVNKCPTFTVGRSKKGTGVKLDIGRYRIQIYNPHSICVFFPDILIPSVNEEGVGEGYCALGWMIDAVAEQLQSMFSGLEIDWFCPFNMDRLEIAIRDSVYARRYFEKYGRFLEKRGIITDKSHGHHELEAINLETAGQDIVGCLRMEEEAIKEENENSATFQKNEWHNNTEKQEKGE